MRPFMDEDFQLHNATARKLFYHYAKHLPIIDYHCHLSPQEIAENRRYANITKLWLEGDHYKWRLMRAAGIDESCITGKMSDYEKFAAFARILPQAIGNPLYHWSHLELRTYFQIHELINERNALIIWEKANALLNKGELSVRDLILKSNVEIICTTDDPTDSLEYHQQIAADASFPVRVLPSFRPDRALKLNQDDFTNWLHKLAASAHLESRNYTDLQAALMQRLDFFHHVGCRVSDHGLDVVPYEEATEENVANIFAKRLGGEVVTIEEENAYKTHLLLFLGKEYAARNWVMQYHMNAARNNNSKGYQTWGPDRGYDSINDANIALPLSRLLDQLERQHALPKTILYSLNPTQNHVIGTMIGNFQGSGILGKLQFGSAWWFNDTKEGMVAQLKTLAEVGLLGSFVGMLTDSRSFLSFTRHEYFRRILCNLLGEWVEAGDYPQDEEKLRNIVENISYYNAKSYFSWR
jgi:glucuronate isomerase